MPPDAEDRVCVPYLNFRFDDVLFFFPPFPFHRQRGEVIASGRFRRTRPLRTRMRTDSRGVRPPDGHYTVVSYFDSVRRVYFRHLADVRGVEAARFARNAFSPRQLSIVVIDRTPSSALSNHVVSIDASPDTFRPYAYGRRLGLPPRRTVRKRSLRFLRLDSLARRGRIVIDVSSTRFGQNETHDVRRPRAGKRSAIVASRVVWTSSWTRNRR